jgi:hypothetical protein
MAKTSKMLVKGQVPSDVELPPIPMDQGERYVLDKMFEKFSKFAEEMDKRRREASRRPDYSI